MKIVLPIAGICMACRPADMYRQNKGQYYRASPYFDDQKSARVPVRGTIPHKESVENQSVRLLKGDFQRGRERYEIFCTPCHGWTGDGDGLIVQRGYLVPSSLHSATIREQSLSHYEEVIAHGIGGMPAYASQISQEDRRRIAGYIRVLQYSRQVPIASLPTDIRQKLEDDSK